MEKNKSITSFELCKARAKVLASADIRADGARCIAEMLMQNRTLTSLSLCTTNFKTIAKNNIEAEGAKYIAENLMINKSLTVLALSIASQLCRWKCNRR